MAITTDASTASGAIADTPDPFTFSHTPGGTPRGVLVLIATEKGGANDLITGVTYGGTALARTTNGFAADTAGELGTSYAYFLGASVPTGTQTVSIDHTGTTQEKHALCITLAAAADLEVVVDGKAQENRANPQITLDSGGTTAKRFSVIYSGKNATTLLTDIAGMTTIQEFVTGAGTLAEWQAEDTPTSGSVTCGWTGVSDDVAMISVAIGEVAAAGTADPFPYVGGGYYPTSG